MSRADLGPMCRAIRFESSDGLLLHGILFGSHDDVVVHVHGKAGNHYENRFLWELSRAFDRVNISLLSFSNRGCNLITEAYGPEGLTYIGGSLELFAESRYDIDGALSAVADLGLRCVALQGHSFGCEKVVDYARRSGISLPLVLLSPADSELNYRAFISGRPAFTGLPAKTPSVLPSRANAAQTVTWSYERNGCPYGVLCSDGRWYPVPVSRQALVDTVGSGALAVLSSGVSLEQIVVVYLGGSDVLQLRPIDEWLGMLRQSLTRPEIVFVENGDHHLGPDAASTSAAIATRMVELGIGTMPSAT